MKDKTTVITFERTAHGILTGQAPMYRLASLKHVSHLEVPDPLGGTFYVGSLLSQNFVDRVFEVYENAEINVKARGGK